MRLHLLFAAKVKQGGKQQQDTHTDEVGVIDDVEGVFHGINGAGCFLSARKSTFPAERLKALPLFPKSLRR